MTQIKKESQNKTASSVIFHNWLTGNLYVHVFRFCSRLLIQNSKI